MNATPPPSNSFSARRSLRGLLACYSLLIVYGSFLPFAFNFDPNFVEWRWLTFVSSPIVPVAKRLSTDVVSNILLFVPWGFFWVASGRDRSAFRSPRAPLLVGAFGFLLGLTIECGQTLSPFRSPSKLDALCNGSGAALGATIAYFFIYLLRKNQKFTIGRLLRERPSLIVLTFLLLVLSFEIAYPFRFTLDISLVSASLKRASFNFFEPEISWRWYDLWIEKLFLFSAMGYLVLQNSGGSGETKRPGRIWFLCSALAVITEAGKVFVVGRAPHGENILLSSAGALVGILVVPPLASLGFVQRHLRELLLLLIIGLITYSELTPFDWVHLKEAPHRIAMIERIPFLMYYYGNPSLALFDIAKKVSLSLPLGFLIASRASTQNLDSRLWRPILGGATVAAVLEVAQIWLRSRTPSVTDVLLIGFGSWIGAMACQYYRSVTGLWKPIEATDKTKSA